MTQSSLSICLTAAALAPVAAWAEVTPVTGVTAYPAGFFAAWQPITAFDMVNRIPGFAYDGGDSARGFAGGGGNVLIDGSRPASKDDSLEEVLRRIPASSVLRIDLIRGGAPGIDMHGKTVIANVVRRSDVKGKLTVTTIGLVHRDGRRGGVVQLDGEKRLGRLALEGSAKMAHGFDDGAGHGPWMRNDGVGNRIVRAREDQAGDGYEYKVTGSAEAFVGGGKLKLSGSETFDPFDYRQVDHLDPGPGGETDHYHENKNTAEIGVRYERRLSKRLNLELYGLQQFGRFHAVDAFVGSPEAVALTGDAQSARFALRKRTAESILRTSLKFEAAKILTLELGAEGDFNWLRGRTGYVQNGMVIALPAANVRVTETRGEVFTTATWRLNPKLTLEAGARFEASKIASSGDVISARRFSYAKPRVTLAWSPDAKTQVRLRVEREVGQVNFDNFTAQTAGINTGTVQAGNPRLAPDRDWVFEAAWERRFWGDADFTLTARHLALTDVVDRLPIFSPSGTFDSPGNIGAGSNNELVVNLTLPTGRLGLKDGLLTGKSTFRRSRVVDPTTGRPRGLSGQNPRQWEAHFRQGLPKWKAVWGVDIFGERTKIDYRFNEIDDEDLKTFVSLYGEYRPNKSLTFRFGIDNLSGRGKQQRRQVFAGPRDRAGLTFVDSKDLSTGRVFFLRVVKTLE